MKNMRIMSGKKDKEICPVCGSTDIYYEIGGYAGKVYRCKRCDYFGALVVEGDEGMAKALEDDYLKNKK